MKIIFIKNPASGSHFRNIGGQNSQSASAAPAKHAAAVQWASCSHPVSVSYATRGVSAMMSSFKPETLMDAAFRMGFLGLAWAVGHGHPDPLLHGSLVFPTTPIKTTFTHFAKPCAELRTKDAEAGQE